VTGGIKVLEVAKNAKSEPVSPLEAGNVKSGKYPVARPLYQYINGTPKGAVKDFVLFELSPEGQKIVEEQGFYSIIGSNTKSGL
jgi:phosphate transport system substrate-binding protein